eukprot:10497725-Alexandrium_andersonii.AAC.1
MEASCEVLPGAACHAAQGSWRCWPDAVKTARPSAACRAAPLPRLVPCKLPPGKLRGFVQLARCVVPDALLARVQPRAASPASKSGTLPGRKGGSCPLASGGGPPVLALLGDGLRTPPVR